MTSTNLKFAPRFKVTPAAAQGMRTQFLLVALLIFGVCLFHLARNLSVYYFGLWAASAGMALVIVIRTPYHHKMRDIALAILISVYVYVILTSVYYSQEYGSPIPGISRLLFIAPTLIGIIYTLNARSFPVFYNIWLAFGVLAALSLPAQYILGPISWFAESSERAGTDRFASLAGSLTMYGNLVGALIFIALTRKGNFLIGVAITVIILVGAVASFQKAALVSAVLGLLSGAVAARMRLLPVASLAASLLLAFGLFFMLADYYTQGIIIGYVQNILGTGDATRASDVTLVDSINSRLTFLPEIAVRYFGFGSLTTGVGVFGGAGGLGYLELPNPHNLIVETLLVFGGLVGGAIIIGLIFLSWRAGLIVAGLRKAPHNDLMAAGVFLNLLLPTIFAGALFYQPVSGSMFICSVLYLAFSMTNGATEGAGARRPNPARPRLRPVR